MITKRCAVCSRIRAYEEDDAYCIVCGSEALETTCSCGRSYDFALHEAGDLLHCPRCGKRLRGRDGEFD
jgi:DNA-directed RNA polymerase subunit RPC12/RpoP